VRWRRAMVTVAVLVVHAALIVWLAASTGDSTPRSGGNGPASAQPAVENFPDARDEPPPGWTGPVFRLSQGYPTTLPDLGDAPWRNFDFRTQTVQYLEAVLGYALDGNTAVDFRGQDNPVRKWYHAPWLHANARSGREFIHGLTGERDSRPGELAPTQTSVAHNWAVSMYNPRGGFVLGDVWKNRDAPDPTRARFPEGTVAFKLIFTTASVSQVPFLKGSLEWEADINRAKDSGPRPTLRLLQIDVAVRDSRADSTTGWVFGTFIYNGDARGNSVWDHMIPVGAMWGNDPDRLSDNGSLAETVINPQARSLVQHLGYQGRLNGPIDNAASSCLSCHSTSQIPADLSQPTTSPVPAARATPAILAQYFRNIEAGTPFTEGQLSLDYSLQLQNGIVNWARQTGLRFPAPADTFGRQRRRLSVSKTVRVTPISR
jgi:hypothetical protein